MLIPITFIIIIQTKLMHQYIDFLSVTASVKTNISILFITFFSDACLVTKQFIGTILGLDSKHLSERERQAELLRLKREARRAQREDKFGNAARLIGLAERQQGELSEK